MSQRLLEKIKTKKAGIALLGLGHVMLPSSSLFADASFQVNRGRPKTRDS